MLKVKRLHMYLLKCSSTNNFVHIVLVFEILLRKNLGKRKVEAFATFRLQDMNKILKKCNVDIIMHYKELYGEMQSRKIHQLQKRSAKLSVTISSGFVNVSSAKQPFFTSLKSFNTKIDKKSDRLYN